MKLKLNYITNIINKDYKKWNSPDVVLLDAQVGTGKTTFIKDVLLNTLQNNEKLLYICNRVSLKRQFKLDLLKKYNMHIPKIDDEIDLEKLDKMIMIGNTVIISYHSMQNSILQEKYYNESYSIDNFKYIVADECHYLFEDSTFNSTTQFAYKKLLEVTPASIKIFISATMEEIKKPLINNFSNAFINAKIWNYTTGRDYSYINCQYFKKDKDIVNLIKNDKTNEKWLIFVTNKENGNKIKKELENSKITVATIYANTKNKELTNIINNNKFDCKVLIATKVLENGINLQDEKLTNIVINAWDQISFIQELGRKRININNAQQVNLYIRNRYKKSFKARLSKMLKDKEKISLNRTDYHKFEMLYDNKINQLNETLFYKDGNKWKVNMLGEYKLNINLEFTKNMLNKFKTDKNAFIKEQLSWLNLEYKEENFTGEVILMNEVKELENYLEKIEGEKLFTEEQQKLSNLIINELTTIKSDIDYRTKILKPSTLEKLIREELNLPYAVNNKQESRGKMRGKRYIIITKIK